MALCLILSQYNTFLVFTPTQTFQVSIMVAENEVVIRSARCLHPCRLLDVCMLLVQRLPQ